MRQLSPSDLNFVLSRCPKDIVKLLRENTLYLAGGFIRETIAGNKPVDIDLFGADTTTLRTVALDLAISRGVKPFTTKNAVTVISHPRLPVQFITRWVFDNAEQTATSFDFTVCQAVVWYDPVSACFMSQVHDAFYADLAARRLVYTYPNRDEDAGGSMLRVIKFIRRGYVIQAPSLGGVIARIAMKVRGGGMVSTEQDFGLVVAGLLREVDPLTIVDGVDLLDEHEVQ
jgi:hypothetical protein